MEQVSLSFQKGVTGDRWFVVRGDSGHPVASIVRAAGPGLRGVWQLWAWTGEVGIIDAGSFDRMVNRAKELYEFAEGKHA